MPSSTNRVILGISMGHGDSSAALIVDNRLVAAAEEERFVRKKHYALFPHESIRYCLQQAKINPDQVETVALARRPWNGLPQKILCLMSHPNLLLSRKKLDKESMEPSMSKLLAKHGLSHSKVVRFEHHLGHLLSVRQLCHEQDVAMLSFDGLGDFVSTAIGKSTGHSTTILKRVYFPHSVGFFYTAMTQFLGFPYFGDEFKVMGLSSYGKPSFLKEMRALIVEKEPFGFRINLKAFPILKHPLRFSMNGGQPYIAPFFDAHYLAELLGFAPRKKNDHLQKNHEDLAKSIQIRFEEIGNHLLKQLHRHFPCESLALAGGCAHNSVWVGKIPRNTPFKKIYVAPASHDAGISVGAALGAASRLIRPESLHWALLGPAFSSAITEPVERHDITERAFSEEDKLIDWMVNELFHDKIIGLFQGRMEFGPRALGSRSILASPEKAFMRNRLNERVKHRESFRPFAASVLWEEQEKWFEDSFFCPSMEAVFSVKPEMKHKIQAVVHADNTCRIQSVIRDNQPFYWKLIDRFRQKTGIPMIINTSFNDSEPIVCTEHDAIHCFLNTDLDHLVIRNRSFSRIAKETAVAV